MNLNELRDKAYRSAVGKGFYDAGTPDVSAYCANIHGEDYTRAKDWVTHGPSDVLSLVAEVRRLSAQREEMGR